MVLAVESVVFYLTKIVLLVHLVPVYPNPAQVSIFSLYSVLSLFVLLGITSVCIAKARKQRLWVSILAYYVITLVPVLGIVQVGVVSRADRFTYLPSIGVFLILGLLAAKIEEKIRKGSPWGAGKRMSGYAAAITVAALLSYATISQIGVWKDSIRFWTYVIDAFPGRVPVAHNNLGLTYVQQHRFLEAINEFKTSIEIDKGYISAYGNLGNEYMRMGRYEDAIQEIQTAILIGPDNAKSHNNLGFAYAQLRRYDEALKEYAAALNLDPSLAESYNNLGLLYADLNRIDEAINEYNTALRLKPAYPAALNNLGIAYMSRQRYQEAIHEFTAALALEPGFTAAHYNLGNAYAAIGSLDQAIAEYRAAIALDPYEPDAHTRLSEVYAKQGRLNDAANEMETAGELLKGNSRYVPLVLTQ
jgi:tetratricopeptide (TPR) repeat protein